MSEKYTPVQSWGRITEDGSFRPMPMRPMLDAGMGPPPFDVIRLDGKVLHIVEAPV